MGGIYDVLLDISPRAALRPPVIIGALKTTGGGLICQTSREVAAAQSSEVQLPSPAGAGEGCGTERGLPAVSTSCTRAQSHKLAFS